MLNDQKEHIQWRWKINALPKEIWPFITDTNRLFKELHQPSLQQVHITQSVEPGLTQLSYNGLNRYEVWEEEPYEWEYPYRFGVIRHYQSGPYKDFKVQVDINEIEGGSELVIGLWMVPRSKVLSFFTNLKLRTIVRRRLKNIVERYDILAVSGQKHYQLNDPRTLVRGSKKRLRQIKEELYNSEVDSGILDRLIDFIYRADDVDLTHLSPFALAEHWQLPPKRVFEVFIHAAKANLLNFSWDLYCPTCRSVQESVKNLNQIHEPIYCDACEQEFDVNFNKTIQLSFSPHPLVRKLDTDQYCIGGPQLKEHIKVQQYLGPGEKRYLKTNLPSGTYVLRSNRSKGTATVHVSEKGTDTVNIHLGARGFSGEEVHISNSPNLSVTNAGEDHQLITLERKEWKLNGVSAARATSSQLFRSLFADEVLRKGEKISVDNLTLMFTDLFDSTGMYNEEGDDKAVGHVMDHFEILHEAVARENGAIVKTIGDSIMAVFCEPGQAMRAYLHAQKMIVSDKRFNEDFQLKAGIHHGSCVAANLNSRIDYFGSTVNIASRFVDYASENELIISKEVFGSHDLCKALNEFGSATRIEDVNIRLKGFQGKPFAIKRIQLGDSPLRLAI